MKNGFNIGFFPEGGIRLQEYPIMTDFKDGAFRLAAETNTPIVPITFPDNYHVLPDDELLNMKWHPCRIIYHKPVYSNGSSEDDIQQLKQDVFRVIQSSLDRQSTKLSAFKLEESKL